MDLLNRCHSQETPRTFFCFGSMPAKLIFSLTAPFTLQATTFAFWSKGGTHYLKIHRLKIQIRWRRVFRVF